MGTHGPYWRRYPEEFNRFRGPIPVADIGGSRIDEKASDQINTYDNAVLYNDYVVSTLIEELRAQQGVSSLSYLSDHG